MMNRYELRKKMKEFSVNIPNNPGQTGLLRKFIYIYRKIFLFVKKIIY